MNSNPIYSLRVSEALESLETSLNGLSNSEVLARQSLYGNNQLEEQIRTPLWIRLLSHFKHTMALLLLVAGGLAFVVKDPVLGVFIWFVVVANAALSFWREYRAEAAMVELQKLLPQYARLIREGEEIKTPAIEIVPGDILVLAEGDRIPADARVIEEFGLRINNSNLTGEAVPVRKSADASLREGISELERPNLLFAGTSVVSGTGKAVVFSTGMTTQFGRIAHLTQTVEEPPSPLQSEIVKLTRTLSLIGLFVGAIVLGVGVSQVGMPFLEAFLLALGILVAVVPEGLPATISLTLAMAASRLAKRGVLVKKLNMMETLGTVSVLCTDKSGTLTQNQMTVREVWISGKHLGVSGVGYEPKGSYTPEPLDNRLEKDLKVLLTAAMLCNNARLIPPSEEYPYWNYLGDQTEAALQVAAIKGGVENGTEASFTNQYPRVHELPFDARRKRMSTIHRNGNKEIAFVKGSPREVLQLCNTVLSDGEIQPLSLELKSEIMKANDEYARGALRVLALAQRELPTRSGAYTPEGVEKDLTFLGLMAMMDPPRPEVAKAVKTLQRAGIRLVMITGDYGLTAESLARRIGMLTTVTPMIITGGELDEMTKSELMALLDQEVIFARMAPEHKLRLVSAYQERGEVVAVTGDGVNDVPALRKADVGVVMGVTGTDVAKEAADVILTNDNFSTFVTAVEEGRAIYDNIRKFITYIFSSNVPEVVPFLMTAMFQFPLILSVRQILAIDLGTDLFTALALGMEKPEPDIMTRQPRRRNQPIIDAKLLRRAFLWLGMIEAVLCFSSFFVVFDVISGQHRLSILPEVIHNILDLPGIVGIPAEQAHSLAITVYFAGVVLAQIGNAFACRTEKLRGRTLGWLSNRALIWGVLFEILTVFGLIYLPFLAKIFDHYPLPGVYWIGLGLFPPILYGMEWVRKQFVRWLDKET
jgi:Ca2+-transporting ATPase